MKKVLIMLLALSVLLCGCATFGTFPNVEKGESTRQEIRSMLGEPAEKTFEDDKEVWAYHFVKSEKKEPGAVLTHLNLQITFKENQVDNYMLTVSQKSVEEKPQEKRELPPSGRPFQPRIKKGKGFINRFDKNNDGRVSRKEFTGPDRTFHRLDKNNDGYIDKNEAPQPGSRRR